MAVVKSIAPWMYYVHNAIGFNTRLRDMFIAAVLFVLLLLLQYLCVTRYTSNNINISHSYRSLPLY